MEINLPDVKAEVTAPSRATRTALVTNDVATLRGAVLEQARTIRYGIGENLYGYDEIAAFRAARSPVGLCADDVAHRDHHLWPRFRHGLDAVPSRHAPGKVGRQMQTWVRMPDGWRIVAAHVSVIDEPEDQKT